MSLSCCVMSHPKRLDEANKLMNRLDKLKKPRDFMGLTLVVDRENNVWLNMRNALLSNQGTHHIILEDDVEVADDFFLIADKATRLRPSNPVSYFTGHNHNHVKIAKRLKKDWVESSVMTYVVAFSLPSDLIDDVIFVVDKLFDENYRLSDFRLSVYCFLRGLSSYSTVPCVVEHTGDDSLIGRSAGRRASLFENVKVGDALNTDGVFVRDDVAWGKISGKLKFMYKRLEVAKLAVK